MNETISFTPETREELAQTILEIATRKEALIPWGAGTHQTIGHPPPKIQTRVQSEKLKRILEFSEKDFVITVESGIMLDELQKFLASFNQVFPYLGPRAKKRTLGGLLSTGSSNYLAYRYGQTRELVLGITVCQADGTFIKGGGKVVKNVSGYEMPKLFVGALGTLGYITDVTLRLFPKPKETKTPTFIFPSPHIGFQVLLELFHSKIFLSMAILEIHPTLTALHLRLEGGTRLVAKEESALVDNFFSNFSLMKWHQSGEELNPFAFLEKYWLVATGAFPPASLPWLHAKVLQVASEAGLISHFLCSLDGTFHVGFEGAPSPFTAKSFQSFNHEVVQHGGWIAYEKVADFLWRDWPMWGEERKEWELSYRLKKLFDPHEIFNPKRFVGRR